MKKPSSKVKLGIFQSMLRMRYFEERVISEIDSGNLEIGFHLLEGHEATVAGVCSSLRADDYITSNHRSLGRYLARGGDSKKLMAEIFGKATGLCEGRAGEMLFSDFSVGHVFTSVTVGAGIPVAVGVGLAVKLRMKTDRVAVSFFGDAAAANAAFHESLNMAAVYKVPVVFVCENNGLSINVNQREYQSTKTVAEKAKAYGIEGISIDGTDPERVLEASSYAVSRARNGRGPTLIDARVPRLRPHKEGMGDTRSKRELDEARRMDPIPRYSRKLRREGVTSEKSEADLRASIQREIEEAIEFAKTSPFPEGADLFANLYSPQVQRLFGN